MKKLLTLCTLVLIATQIAKAQDTIAAWTFPTGTLTDANPDKGNLLNATNTITTQGGTSAIDFSKNGFTTKAAQATEWQSGANVKFWQVELNTTGYNNILVSSKQTAGGANPGPRDFKLEYKIGTSGVWENVPGTAIVTANNWTSGVLDNVQLPVACNNIPLVYIRWIMTSDTSITPPALVLSSGTGKIDDIYFKGSPISSENQEIVLEKFNITFVGYSEKSLILNFNTECTEMKICDISGRVLNINNPNSDHVLMDLSHLQNGIYIIKVISKKREVCTRKFIVF